MMMPIWMQDAGHSGADSMRVFRSRSNYDDSCCSKERAPSAPVPLKPDCAVQAGSRPSFFGGERTLSANLTKLLARRFCKKLL